jgi:hypothetical protein
MVNNLIFAENAKGRLKTGFYGKRCLPVMLSVTGPHRGDKFDLQLSLYNDDKKLQSSGDSSWGLPVKVDLTNDGVLKIIHDMLAEAKIEFEDAKQLIGMITSHTDISGDQAFTLVTDICKMITDRNEKVKRSGRRAVAADRR